MWAEMERRSTPRVFYVEWNFSGGLHGVGVEIDVALQGEFSDLRERLNGAEFVVGVHDGD